MRAIYGLWRANMRRNIQLIILDHENRLKTLERADIFSPKGSLSYEGKQFRMAWIKLKIELWKIFL